MGAIQHDMSEIALTRFARRAMATVFEIVLPWEHVNASEVASAGFDLIEQLEAQLTIYRSTSELSRLNHIAAQAPVPVEKQFFDLLALARRIYSETNGAFDITAGPLIKSWGFFQRQGRIPDSLELAIARSRVGLNQVHLDEQRRTVRYACAGLEINLGSIGKGYALDRVAMLFGSSFSVPFALLNGGTSSVLALGAGPNLQGWLVGVKQPSQRRRLGTLRLIDRGMASSGTSFQHFEYNGRRYGHLLDPRTGYPAEGTALAVALAPTAAEADALATAFFVLGVDGTREYCDRHTEISAILVPDEADAEPVTINIAADEWQPAAPDEIYPSDTSYEE